MGLAAWLCCVNVVAATTPAQTTPEQTAARIEAAAREEVATRADQLGWGAPKAEVSVVTGNRPIEDCRGPVEVHTRDARSVTRMRFSVECRPAAGAAPVWRREVLVRASVSAEVLVTARPVPAGQVFSPDDLTLASRNVVGADDAIGDTDAVLGQTPRRALRSGEIVRKNLLQWPLLVRRGDPVRIIATREQVSVSMAGEALDDGREGGVIRVRNLSSGKPLRARVTGPGEVQTVEVGAPMTQSRD